MKILLAEDDTHLRETVVRILVDAGYDVSAVGNGHAACALIQAGDFDGLVTDILMPERDGLEVIKEFRDRFPQVGVIGMSGGGDLFDGELCCDLARRLGADQVLSKPFSYRELLEAVERMNRE